MAIHKSIRLIFLLALALVFPTFQNGLGKRSQHLKENSSFWQVSICKIIVVHFDGKKSLRKWFNDRLEDWLANAQKRFVITVKWLKIYKYCWFVDDSDVCNRLGFTSDPASTTPTSSSTPSTTTTTTTTSTTTKVRTSQCRKTRNSLAPKIFRESNYFAKQLLSRNFCQKVWE